ncbi:MAG TPA: glycosyltransferase [Bacteroidia bacterium]|jgi:cellulose synthase/poly-beta-1,6-N-acetylglucosamine synthase-like glycosyltransferase
MMNSYEQAKEIIKISKINKKDIWTVRALIGCALAIMALFVWWFVRPEHIGYQPIYWMLTIALLFKLVKMLHEWYHYWNLSIPVPPPLKTNFTVDVLTTACPGEPKEMIVRTLRAMVNIRYPHTNYLCDEGNDPYLKSICKELGVVHVTRVQKINAKAGNINNALKQATGDICIVLDPDHVPVPEFIDRVLPYFEDPQIGFVQCVQAYGNQSESIIAKGAAEQTYHFYGPMMMSMNSYGTVQAIGANCSFRRTALDSIGGHAAGLSEDMHTAMQLHAKGWKSCYIPEVLTRGLVPATLSAYYSQQLKWSRGTFELLFRTYPKLYKNFTWRQKLHYFTIPLYFLFGLINFIDILIPLIALSMAEVPWEVDLQDFGMFFLPLCALSMIIRLFAQRWLLEKHERGFHLAGGLLRTATWWIFLVGFIYSIFNIKVPYIPTPKEDAHQNFIKLSLPNLIIALICGAGIAYGLSIDWSPYSLAMAFYAILNASMMAFIVFMSQQRFLDSMKKSLNSVSILATVNNHISNIAFKTQHIIYGILRNGPIALLIGTALLFFSYSSVESADPSSVVKQKEIGGFFTGITLGENESTIKVGQLNQSLKNNFEIVSVHAPLDTNAIAGAELNMFKSMNVIPMINLDMPSTDDSTWRNISSGKYDAYLEKYAAALREYSNPVYMNFSPGFDDKQNLHNSSYEFVKAWQYAYTFFNDLGISNITWIWSPKSSSSIAFYPGSQFVDWIGISCLNYAGAKTDSDSYSFSEMYTPYRELLGPLQKPFIITEMGAAKGELQSVWYKDAFNSIRTKYKEVRAVVFYDQKKTTSKRGSNYVTDFGMNNESLINTIAQQFDSAPFNKEVFYNAPAKTGKRADYKSKFVKGTPGKFDLIVNGKPYYVQGVAYNTAHDWRDGNMPLTRRQVEKDMQKIKEMGANTIRRYDHGIYDRNVLNIAGEYNLNVLYGFWFDPTVDYYKDSAKVQEYIENVEEKVAAFKDHSSLVAWSLGNETWGLLKHNYSKPYLTKVRQSYVQMIEMLAQRIHNIDPTRPVLSCMEHEEYQLPGELAAFHDGAPSIDVIGVNSYYREQISRLNHVFYQFDSLRPYLVSEFGPRGYWDPHYNRTSKKLLVEDSEVEKAQWYRDQWNHYIEANKGYNIGGIAYCWHDRMEGSNTWFGLTDYRGRVKLPYYALKEEWTGIKTQTIGGCSIRIPKEVKPGMEYSFTAVVENGKNAALNYEWALHKDDFLQKVDAFISDVDESEVILKIPSSPSNYRLYLYVSDKNGNVNTSSVPIKVY